MNLQEALKVVSERQALNELQAYEAMKSLMAGENAPELVGGFLAALRTKGESADEITGFARAMREASIRIYPKVKGRLIDTCSTGGAKVKLFNIGTTAAFVAAADGVPVAKHGNRSSTRPSGSADILEALGANLQAPPMRVQGIIEEVGIGFLFSPAFHPAMKHAMPARKALGIRTVFNLLGPLTNPAGAKGQVLGVPDPIWIDPIAKALAKLGVEHALVLHAQGADEPALHGVTQLAEVHDGAVKRRELAASTLGLPGHPFAAYAPLPPPEAAKEARRILSGGDGPRAAAVQLAAGLALHVAGHANSIQAGVDRAGQLLQDQLAATKLEDYIQATRRPGASAA